MLRVFPFVVIVASAGLAVLTHTSKGAPALDRLERFEVELRVLEPEVEGRTYRMRLDQQWYSVKGTARSKCDPPVLRVEDSISVEGTGPYALNLVKQTATEHWKTTEDRGCKTAEIDNSKGRTADVQGTFKVTMFVRGEGEQSWDTEVKEGKSTGTLTGPEFDGDLSVTGLAEVVVPNMKPHHGGGSIRGERIKGSQTGDVVVTVKIAIDRP